MILDDEFARLLFFMRSLAIRVIGGLSGFGVVVAVADVLSWPSR